MRDEDVTQLIQSLKDNAERLGLVWTRRFGTVADVTSQTSVTVVLDAPETVDAVAIDCVSIIGQLVAGDRVVVDSVPPAGKFVSGFVSSRGYRIASVTGVTASGTLTVGTSVQDVPGCTVTATAHSGALYVVDGVFDFQYTVAGAATAVGTLEIDGVAQAQQGLLDGGTTGTPRATVAQNWNGSLSAGSHTFQLRAIKTAAAATIRANTHTTMRVTILEPL